jgi:nicotinamidase-related amidase
MKQALLVIDVQESFRHRPYFCDRELPRFLSNVQALIDGCREIRVPVVQVFHQETEGGAANPFTAASGQVRAMPQLTLNPALVVHKPVHSALYGRDGRGELLEHWLRREGIGELLVSGIRTEQCCETTTRHACDAGFRVRYVTDATLTFPMRTRAGRTVGTDEIRERTELVLEGRFADVVSTAAALG